MTGDAALTKLVATAGTATATDFEHSRSWIAGSISCKRFELSAAVGRLGAIDLTLA